MQYTFNENPIIILGNPRSGTTLLRLVLTSHPDICIPPEGGFMCWLWPQFSDWSRNDWLDHSKIRKFSQAVERSKKFETWKISEAEITKELSSNSPESYRHACCAVYALYARKNKSEAAHWGDKNNFYTSQTELLTKLFPKGRFIHLVRDPRDVFCSYRDMAVLETTSIYKPVLSTDAAAVAEEWVRNNENVNRVLGTKNGISSCNLRYEDLVSNPEKEASKLCSWMGIDYHADMLQFHELNKKNILEPAETMDWKKKTLQKISTEQCERFRKELNSDEIASIEDRASALMKQFRYLPV